MSRRGENIYKRKDNRWEGRYVRGYDTNGKTKLGYVYGKTYKEVKEKLKNAKINEKRRISTDKKYFDSYCNEWLLISRNRIKESTYVKYYKIVHKHLEPVFGQMEIDKIDSLCIESFSNKLLVEKQLSPKTVRDILAVLHGILKYIQSKQNLNNRNIEIFYPKETQKEVRILTPQEQERFVKYLLSDMDSAKFGTLLALFSGMRIGEICALKWQEIDLTNQTITVNSTMQRISDVSENAKKKTRILISTAKSEHSHRIIPLTEYVVALCRQMYVDNPDAYILTGSSKKFMEPRTLQLKLKKYTSDCNLEGIHFHSLRHTFATRCVEVDFEIKSLSDILGHASAKITMDRYVHPSLDLKRANMEKLKKTGF